MSLYPLSRSPSVHCTIYPQKADKAICRHARCLHTVANRASFLQISSSLRCSQIRSIGVTPFSPTISASSFRRARARFTFLPRAFLFLDRLARNFVAFDSTHVPFIPRALSSRPVQLTCNFATFDSARVLIRARIDAAASARCVASRPSENFTTGRPLASKCARLTMLFSPRLPNDDRKIGVFEVHQRGSSPCESALSGRPLIEIRFTIVGRKIGARDGAIRWLLISDENVERDDLNFMLKLLKNEGVIFFYSASNCTILYDFVATYRDEKK